MARTVKANLPQGPMKIDSVESCLPTTGQCGVKSGASPTNAPKHERHSQGESAPQNDMTLAQTYSVQAHDGVEDVPSDSDSDSESDRDIAKKPPRVSEKRRAQDRVFSAWISQREETVAKEEIRAVVQNVNDEALSIRKLMSKQESNVIITDPREYQIELFEKAKNQNIIAVLDTGSGKTLIAVLLLRYIIDQEIERRSMGQEARISFFLVDCVTLVFQQFAVLECNLDQNIERFCGEMGCDFWDKRTWETHFKENMVIVCTAEILYQCLMHSFIKIDQINLLIFDEAHHAKKNHAYAKIIKEFYVAEEEPSKRPKVFGMTASPVDARQDVVQAAKELEAMLHCQIATTSDLSLVRMSISRPHESIAAYKPLSHAYLTPLATKLKTECGDMEALDKLFKFAREATSQLGEWCADYVWSLALAEEEARKVERKIERTFIAEKESRPIEVLDDSFSRLRGAQESVHKWEFARPSFEGNSLSPKVQLLLQYLDLIFEKPSATKCIVFVKRRYSARLLGELSKLFGTPHIRIGLLIGTRYGDPGDLKISFRQQVLTLTKFRKGELNCLFATSIAEEGLDIPDCNVVIRFDLYDTLIQYIQSRGRARHTNSKYIHMVERGNKMHLQTVTDVQLGEDVMRRFCEALPADRLLQGNDCDLGTILAKERSMKKYVEPGTGATLTYASSLVVLSHFVGCLPSHSEAVQQATFVMSVENKQYVCEVIFPEKSPIHSAKGTPSSRKAIAKRSAAFEACLLLRKHNHLDEHLIPTIHKLLPEMRNARLAVNMNKNHSYPMRIKPDLWEKDRGSRPTELYVTIIELRKPENLGRPCQPLAILTRTHLPDFPPFPLHLQVGKTSDVLCTPFAQTLKVTDARLADLTEFTFRIYKDIFNKHFKEDEAQMSYWLAPICKDRMVKDEVESPDQFLDWLAVEYVKAHKEIKWKHGMPHSQFTNHFLVDPFAGYRRFFSSEVLPNLGPLDAVPHDAAVWTDSKDRNKGVANILDYSVRLYKNWKERMKNTGEWDLDQPVILAHKIPTRLNWLDTLAEKDIKEETKSYLCPQPLLISALPITVVAMSYLFPAIISRLESYLIALDACASLGLDTKLGVKPGLALEALTKDSDNTHEHNAEQIRPQRGMGPNYERLEFIGDCFLKMATSISIFAKYPEDDEFDYHVKRMLMICNRNLFKHAVANRLYEYIRTMSFSRRDWYQSGLKLMMGKGFNQPEQKLREHPLGDKTIADIAEAIIGAALLSYMDTNNRDMAVRAVTALVCSSDHDVLEWSGYYRMYTKPQYQVVSPSAIHRELAEKFERRHDYHFSYPALLYSAFIHPSYPSAWSKGIPCYQRLEFLGDALLDMASISFLFHRHPDKDPQWLTEHKMAMVSNKFLSALSVKLGFHRHLRAHSQAILNAMSEYVEELEECERQSEGRRDYWTLAKNPPKPLSDVVEACIGAMFVDSEFDFEVVQRFFDDNMRWFFEDMSIYDEFANNHPVTKLNNKLTLEFGCTNFRILAREIPDIDGSPLEVVSAILIHEKIMADGSASSGKNAKVKAAARALEKLDGLAPYEFRRRYDCNCESGKNKEMDEKMMETVGTAI